MAPTSFPLFPKLPTELRLMIWEHALPAPIEEQPLYFYNQTRWTCGVCEHDIITDEKRYVNFQHGQVAPLQINIPLYFVNREAHKIALSWGVQQGLDLWPCQSQERTTTFARLFNPETDILYVAARYWSEFWYEDLKTIRRLPQLLHKPVIHPPLKYLALSAKILRERPQHFGYMLARYRNLQKVFIV
ncbi:2EXR domain-containing protein, partial [Aspergillus homomorphus CBS 101889]